MFSAWAVTVASAAAQDPSEETRDVCLRVVAAEDGAPLVGAVVEGEVSRRDGRRRRTLGTLRAETDANGDARLAVASGVGIRLELTVAAEGRAEVGARFYLPAEGEVDLLEVDLRRLVTTRIRVVEETGEPVPDVRVWPRDCYSGRFAVLALREDLTGEDGWTGPLRLPEGEILTEMRGIPPGLRGSGWTRRYIEVGAGQDVEVALERLDPLPEITGVLRDHHGVPVPGVQLVAYEEGRFFPVGGGRSGPDGCFRLRVARGIDRVRLETYEEEHRELADDPWVRPGARDLAVRLAEPASVALKVSDVDTGEPVEDFSVAVLRVRKDRHQHIHGHRDLRLSGPHGGGRLVVGEVLRGANLLLVLPDEETGYLPSGFRRVMVDGPHTGVTVRLYRPTPFRVRVVDSEGTPMAGSRVTLVQRMRPDSEGPWAASIRGPEYGGNRLWGRFALCEATTNAKGLAELAWQPWDRPCRLRVTGKAHVETEVDAPELEPGMEPITVKVGRAARIVGTAELDRLAEFGVDRYGVRGPGTVESIGPAIVLRDAATGGLLEGAEGKGFPIDADGGFACTGVRPGRWQLLFRFRAAAQRTLPHTLAEVTVGAGHEREAEVDLARVAPAAVKGQVYVDGATAQPRELGFTAYGRDHLGRRERMWSGGTFPVAFPRGEYRLGGLPPGDYVFRITTVIERREVELRTFDEVRLRPGEGRRLDLHFHHRVARIRLVAADEETPVAGRTVAVEPDGGLLVSNDGGWITVDPVPARVMEVYAFAAGVKPRKLRGLHYLDPQPARTVIGRVELADRGPTEATLVVEDGE